VQSDTFHAPSSRLCPPHLSVCVREAVRSSIDLLVMTRETHGRCISRVSLQHVRSCKSNLMQCMSVCTPRLTG